MNARESMFPFGGDVSELNPRPMVVPQGIEVRDGVAIHCLQGILANSELTKIGHSGTGGPGRAAEMAYKFADALIEASTQEA